MKLLKSTKKIILLLNSDVINTVIRYLLFGMCVCVREREKENVFQKSVLKQKEASEVVVFCTFSHLHL